MQFDNGKLRWIKKLERLCPLEDFLKQGKGYVLKSANSDESANSDPTTATNAPMPISQSEQTHRALIRTTRAQARQLIQDQQAKDQIINMLQKRQSQLIEGNQDQAPLINLIDTGLRPYILDLS